MTDDRLRHFLLVFDHRRGELVKQEEFDRVEPAMAAYEDEERRYQREHLVEVVLIGSDSIETVRITHANYFNGTVEINKYLAGI